METPRPLARPLSWFLARLRSREEKALRALRLSVSGASAPGTPSPLLEKTEDLLWTCR
jgi:hypothetical protein